MIQYQYGIDIRWRVEPISLVTLGEKFLDILEAISNATPEGEEWQLGKPPYRGDYITIEKARAKPAQWVEENVAIEDNVADPEAGYQLMALRMAEPSSRMMSLVGRIGGRLGDTINFDVGTVTGPSDLETVTYALFRTVLLTVVASLPPIWANARFSMRDYNDIALAPGVPPPPASSHSGRWLSYLCATLAEGLTPPVGVPCERTPDGGLLMIAAEERLDPFNTDHMRRSRAIDEVMIARLGNPPRPGYWPLAEEWPPTREALRRRGTDKPPPLP